MIPMIHKKKKSVVLDKHGKITLDYRKTNRDLQEIVAKIKRTMKRRARKGYSCPIKSVLPLLPRHLRTSFPGAEHTLGVRRTGS